MKATFTLHNLTAAYLERLAAMEAKEAFFDLNATRSNGLGHAIKLKIGNGDMRDAVAFNSISKSPDTSWTYKIEPRKGYKLATFTAA